MGELLQQVLLFVTIPVAATILGGAVAAYRTPGPTLRSAIQHFAAGVVFAAVAVELLPELHEQSPLPVMIGFALGVTVMLLVKHFFEGEGHGENPAEAEEVQEPEETKGLIITIGVDLVVDGLLIGLAFVAGAEQGLLLTVALTLEVLFLGLAVVVGLSAAGETRSRITLVTTVLALLLGASAVIGALLFGRLSGAAFAGMLAFGAAALLYLVTEELLVEAHEVKETPLSTAMFFAGFLVLFLIEMYAG